MFASAFSWIGDFFVFLAFILFTLQPLCWIYEHAADGGCGGGLDFAYRLEGADRRPLLMTTGTRMWTLNPSVNNVGNYCCLVERNCCVVDNHFVIVFPSSASYFITYSKIESRMAAWRTVEKNAATDIYQQWVVLLFMISWLRIFHKLSGTNFFTS